MKILKGNPLNDKLDNDKKIDIMNIKENVNGDISNLKQENDYSNDQFEKI
jgi:hypothetical protein